MCVTEMNFMFYLGPILSYLMQKEVPQNLNHFNFKHFGSQALKLYLLAIFCLFDYSDCNLLYYSFLSLSHSFFLSFHFVLFFETGFM